MDAKKGIEEANATFAKAWARGDAAGCAARCTDDVVVLPPDQPMLQGKKAAEQFYQSSIRKTGAGPVENKVVEFGADGDLAYEIGTYDMKSKTPQHGKFVNVFRRQQDGSWKVCVDMLSSDKP